MPKVKQELKYLFRSPGSPRISSLVLLMLIGAVFLNVLPHGGFPGEVGWPFAGVDTDPIRVFMGLTRQQLEDYVSGLWECGDIGPAGARVEGFWADGDGCRWARLPNGRVVTFRPRGLLGNLFLGCLLGGAVHVSVAAWRRRFDRRWAPGHCRQCGYDLTGNESGVCPECGRAVEADDRREGGSRDATKRTDAE